MSHSVPFNQETYRPHTIPGNQDADRSVEFDLSQVGGADLVRLKTLMFALGGLGLTVNWTPELQESVAKAMQSGPKVFENGIDAIRNFTIPTKLALKLGLVAPATAPANLPDFPITRGDQFAKVVGFQTVLGLEVAMELARISTEGDVDTRFFDSSTTSRGTPTTAGSSGRSGDVTTARKRRAKRATAARRTSTASS
jgi:hypothetical protein